MFGPRPLACLLSLLAAAPAAAKDIDAATVKKLTRAGAFTADLRGKAGFRVPQGFRYVSEDKLEEFAKLLDYPLTGEEVGMVMPDDCRWVAAVALPKSDPLAGQDAKAPDKSALLEWQQRYAADRRAKAGGTGGLPSKVVGWTHQPAYDADKKRLTMGVRLTPDAGESGADVVRHQTFVYGEAGSPVCLEVVAGAAGWDKPVAEVGKLAGEVTLPTPEPAGSGGGDLWSRWTTHFVAGSAGALVLMFLARGLTAKRSPAARPAGRRPGLPR